MLHICCTLFHCVGCSGQGSRSSFLYMKLIEYKEKDEYWWETHGNKMKQIKTSSHKFVDWIGAHQEILERTIGAYKRIFVPVIISVIGDAECPRKLVG
jgi:hypothetical protein